MAPDICDCSNKPVFVFSSSAPASPPPLAEQVVALVTRWLAGPPDGDGRATWYFAFRDDLAKLKLTQLPEWPVNVSRALTFLTSEVYRLEGNREIALGSLDLLALTVDRT